MLLHFDHDKPLYVLGSSVQTDELVEMCRFEIFLRHSNNALVIKLHHDDISNLAPQSQCILGFTNYEFRKCFLTRYETFFHWPSLIDQRSTIDLQYCTIGKGSIIYPNSTILHQVTVGDFNLVSPLCYLSHGCITGSNVVLAPGVVVGGSTSIGDNVFIGQSSSVKDKISICSDVFVTMGSVVTKNIVDIGQHVGNKKTIK